MTEQEIRIKALEFAVEYANAINKGCGWDRFKTSDIERMSDKNLNFIKTGKWY